MRPSRLRRLSPLAIGLAVMATAAAWAGPPPLAKQGQLVLRVVRDRGVIRGHQLRSATGLSAEELERHLAPLIQQRLISTSGGHGRAAGVGEALFHVPPSARPQVDRLFRIDPLSLGEQARKVLAAARTGVSRGGRLAAQTGLSGTELAEQLQILRDAGLIGVSGDHYRGDDVAGAHVSIKPSASAVVEGLLRGAPR
jgi:hypothetical protein